jgi:hypothetical protein
MKLAIFHSAKGLRQFPVGIRAAKGLQETQRVHSVVPNAVRPKTEPTTHPVCLCVTDSNERNSSLRKRNIER